MHVSNCNTTTLAFDWDKPWTDNVLNVCRQFGHILRNLWVVFEGNLIDHLQSLGLYNDRHESEIRLSNFGFNFY